MMVVLQALLATAAAEDPARSEALHALRDEFGGWTNRATDEERDEDYAEACRRGWRPACAPSEWRDEGSEPDAERLERTLEPVCQWGDALACFAVHRFVSARIPPAELARMCDEDGFAPACTAAALADPTERESRLRRGCLGTGAAATIDRDPLACRHLGETEPERLVDACDGGDGAACAVVAESRPDERADWLARACEGGHGPSCVAFAAAIEASLPVEVSQDAVPDPEAASKRGDRHRALVRACDLREAVGCREAALDHARGRGVPVDLPASHDGFWGACQLGDGEACARLADAILDGETERFGITPRKLFERGCDLGDRKSCREARYFDRRQRFATRRLVARGRLLAIPYLSFRPWLGGAAGITGQISMPRVDEHAARRRVVVTLEQGAYDPAFGLLDRRETPENLSTFAAHWRQEPVVDRPWGARVGVGTQYWQGAPRYGDAAVVADVPGEAEETFDLNTFVWRFDLERTAVQNPRVGVGISVSSITAWETQEAQGDPEGSLGRAVLSVFQRAPTSHPLPMRGGDTELSLYVGGSTTLDAGHYGVWFTDQRSIPLVRTRAQRDALSFVSDVAAGLRQGEVPSWLEHHHQAKLSPNLGSWQLMRGQPATLMRGVLPARARAGLRWWLSDYHGLQRHIGFYVTPFVEAGVAVPDLQDGSETQWRSDGGLSATLTFRRDAALHIEALVVSDLDDGGYAVVPSLVLQQVLDPWR